MSAQPSAPARPAALAVLCSLAPQDIQTGKTKGNYIPCLGRTFRPREGKGPT